jgi:hypothetical protein
MWQRIAFSISALLLTGCATLPAKPQVTMYTPDFETGTLLSSDSTPDLPFTEARPVGPFICFAGTDWAKVAAYNKALRSSAGKVCP